MPDLDYRNLPPLVLARLAEGFGEAVVSARREPALHITYQGRKLEHRAHRGVELRAGDDGTPIIDGYATVYEHPYEVMGGPPYGWTETIARGAADKSIAEQDEVYLFFDHEGLPLSATKAGTLTLESDKMGLRNESRIDPRSSYSMEIVNRLERGELDAMSFAFRAVRQEWNEDYTERRILETKLYDVSVVSFPANPATVVQLRGDVVAELPAPGMPLGLALAMVAADRSRVA
jgi:hypothetical protein